MDPNQPTMATFLNRLFFSVSLVMAFALTACQDPSVVELRYHELNGPHWAANERIEFPLTIENAKANYTLYYLVRYTDDYPYYNLWLKRQVLDSQKVRIAERLQGMDLFDATTGKPSGEGSTRYDHAILGDSTISFPKAGKYIIGLSQYMRKDSLSGIQAVGIKLVQND
jgi:gliding motility-associated lipoprotein GldH